MNIEKTSIDAVNAQLTVNVLKSDYEENINKTLKDYGKRANMPGFRPGKVPVGLLKKMYGKQVLVEEVNKAVGNALMDYIRENDLQVLGEPLPAENQAEQNFDEPKDFTFVFDVALAPEFEIEYKGKGLKYYNVTPGKALVDQQIEMYKGRFGTYSQEETSDEKDMLSGTAVELEGGKPKDGGVSVERAVLTPAYLSDDEAKKALTGAKKGDSIVLNLKKAFGGSEAEIASFIKEPKEKLEHIGEEFLYTIEQITRYTEAEIGQDLFDKVYGKDNVKSEEEFVEKVKAGLQESLEQDGKNKFAEDVRQLVVKETEGLAFPDALLKKWLVVSNDKATEESVEKDYPHLVEDLKWTLAKEKVAKAKDIKIEPEEVNAFAKKVARAQFAQYGMVSAAEELVENYAQDLLKNREVAQNIFNRVQEEKVLAAIKEIAKPKEESIDSEAFHKLLEKNAKA